MTCRARSLRLLILVGASVGTLAAAPPPAPPLPDHPLTLQECYDLAKRRSEELAIRGELIEENKGRLVQSIASVLPRASFKLTDERQDGSGGSAFTLRHIPTRYFHFSQPIFSGFKEFSAMAGVRALTRQRASERRRAEDLLLVDVSDAFYLLLEQRAGMHTLEGIRASLIVRIDELGERQKLGRSRPNEVKTAEAQLRRVEADYEDARSHEVIARQLLEFLTGLDGLVGIIDPNPPLTVDDEAVYLEKAKLRPDVVASREAWNVARNQLRVARAQFFPTVDLESNYYTKRTGVAADVDWDVLLTVDVPLFQGGKAVGASMTAASEARQAKLLFAKTERTAQREVLDAYARFESALARRLALANALQAAEENFRLQVEDYRLSLVNNLDVLDALRTLEDARRDEIGARYDAKRLYWLLRATAGEGL